MTADSRTRTAKAARTVTQAGGRRSSAARQRRELLLVAAVFLAPALLALFITRLLPAGVSLVESFMRSTILNPTPRFVGLQNYAELFADPAFHSSLLVTLVFTVILNPLQVGLAFLLAVLYSRSGRTTRFFRALVIVPVVVPPAISAIFWGIVYRPDGLANALLRSLGLPEQPFLTSPDQALGSIMLLVGWVGLGYWMLFLIAGINDIPEELYEAASIDGAGSWRKHLSVTLPLVRRPMLFVLVAATAIHFITFAPVQILTRGGPNGSTNLIMYDVYKRAYDLRDVSMAQAEVVILVLLALSIVAIQFRMMRGSDR